MAAGPAPAHPALCGPHQQIVAELESTYGEVLVAVGLTTAGAAVLEIYAAPQGSWTVLVTGLEPGAPACVIQAGDNWTPLDIAGQPGVPA